MAERSRIYVSAVFHELRTARQLVGDQILAAGLEPDWRDIRDEVPGDLRPMLRRRIDSAAALVQLVGHQYGPAPEQPTADTGNLSYAQFEAQYAREKGLPVWQLILDTSFPADCSEPEPDEICKLQQLYRQSLCPPGDTSRIVRTTEDLQSRTADLLQQFSSSRRFAIPIPAIGILLVLALVGTAGFYLNRWMATPTVARPTPVMSVAPINPAVIRESIRSLPGILMRLRREQPWLDAGQSDDAAFRELGEHFQVEPGALRESLRAQLADVIRSTTATTIEQAHAAFLSANFSEALRLGPAAATEALGANPPQPLDALHSHELAGWAAELQGLPTEAFQRYQAAARLADPERDPVEWARVQWDIAVIVEMQNRPAEALDGYQRAADAYQAARGREDAAVLTLRGHIARMLRAQGRYVEAAQAQQTLLETLVRARGADHPETLRARAQYASTLRLGGRYPEEEAEHRVILDARTRLVGPTHPDTLVARNNLAAALYSQGKHAAAEQEQRSVLDAQVRVLGADHPDTLRTRMNLANALAAQARYADAEAENRAVLASQERALGPDHPDLFRTCGSLAVACYYQQKRAEALQFAERAERGLIAALGKDHPDTRRATAMRLRLQPLAR